MAGHPVIEMMIEADYAESEVAETTTLLMNFAGLRCAKDNNSVPSDSFYLGTVLLKRSHCASL
jgi:hypothetical protein